MVNKTCLEKVEELIAFGKVVPDAGKVFWGRDMRDLEKEIKDNGCGKGIFKNGINEFGQGDNMTCGTFWAGRRHLCTDCKKALEICEKALEVLETKFAILGADE